jgi:mRNA-degrading endonuclease RelE of RelBE toxin-antitoxin system
MTPPFVWTSAGSVRIQVSPHALPRLHALPADARARLVEMLNEIASGAPEQFSSEGLLRLHVGSFVVLYTISPDEQGLTVQHILVPAEQEFSQTG